MDDTEVIKLVFCPTCNAGRDKPCQTLQNVPMGLTHISRQKRARNMKKSSLALKQAMKE